MARPSNYDSRVKPHLEKIRQMRTDMTEEQIAKTLGVDYSTFRNYKKKYPELQEALVKGQRELVIELKSSLIQKAKGFTYTEKKVVKQNGKIVREEEYTRQALPDVAALHLLLKNYSTDWHDDPQMYELKKKAQELEQKKVEANEWLR